MKCGSELTAGSRWHGVKPLAGSPGTTASSKLEMCEESFIALSCLFELGDRVPIQSIRQLLLPLGGARGRRGTGIWITADPDVP